MGLLKYKKVYVMAPYHYASGGPELSHQLVDYLKKKGKEAFVVYEKEGIIIDDDITVTKQYQKYNIVVSPTIEDKKENVIVLPEIYLSLIPRFKNIQVCIWWMSVDNAVKANRNFLDTFFFQKGFYERLRVIKHWRYNSKNLYSLKKLKKDDLRLTHFYQSVYAQQYLYGLGINRVIRLTDFINPDILNNVDSSKVKENIILYNPSKGFRYTQKLIARMDGYKFFALKGLNREQLNDLFDRAKVYIDFGNFPGNDRLPREAAVHNCCILTGKFGASRFYEDVPINDKYKFDMTHVDYKAIKDRIDDVFAHYDERIKDFEYIRENISHQQENFYREIDNIFI